MKPKKQAKKPKITVFLDGGLVDGYESSVPVTVDVVDFDVSDMDPADLCKGEKGCAFANEHYHRFAI